MWGKVSELLFGVALTQQDFVEWGEEIILNLKNPFRIFEGLTQENLGYLLFVFVISVSIALLVFKLVVGSRVPVNRLIDAINKDRATEAITNGLARSEIYTRQGKMRVVIQNRIIQKQREMAMAEGPCRPALVEHLREMGLVDEQNQATKRNKNRIRQEMEVFFSDTSNRRTISRATNGFQNYGAGQKTTSLNQPSATEQRRKPHGLSPKEFFRQREACLGDVVGVYIIYNVTKDKYYVGQAKRLYFRVNQHLTGHGNGDVYADYKYGDEFEVSLLPLTGSGYQDLDKFEKDKIKEYYAYTDGYNKTAGNG